MGRLTFKDTSALTTDKWLGHLGTIGRWFGQNLQYAYRSTQFTTDDERVGWVTSVMQTLANTVLTDNGIGDFQDAQFFCDYSANVYCPSGYYCDNGICMPNGSGSGGATGAILDALLYAHLQTIGTWVGRNSQVAYQDLPEGVDSVQWVKKVMNDLKGNLPQIRRDAGPDAHFFCDAQHKCPAGYVCDGGICVPV